MIVAGLVMAGLAAVLASPLPRLVIARCTLRDPVAKIVLWQAVGLAGGCSVIAACLLHGVAPLIGTGVLAGALRGDVDALAALPVWRWLLLIAGLVVLVDLLVALASTAVSVVRRRRRHATLLRLVSSPSDSLPDTQVIDAPAALAYCLPVDGGTTVVSTGLLSALDEREQRAVIAHERAHLRFRHDLLVLPFAAWRDAMPWSPSAGRALGEVGELTELMADDAARRGHSAEAIASAIRRTADAADLRERDLLDARLGRLASDLPEPQRTRRQRARAAAIGAGLVSAVPLLLIVALAAA